MAFIARIEADEEAVIFFTVHLDASFLQVRHVAIRALQAFLAVGGVGEIRRTSLVTGGAQGSIIFCKQLATMGIMAGFTAQIILRVHAGGPLETGLGVAFRAQF